MSEMMQNTQNLEYQLKTQRDKSALYTPGKSRPTSANVSELYIREKSTVADSNKESELYQ